MPKSNGEPNRAALYHIWNPPSTQIGTAAQRMNKIRPLIVEEEDFIDINKNTAAQIAYTASVGRDTTANPKNSEQSAVRTKDVFPSVSILEEIKKYAPAFRYIKPHDMAIS